MIENYFYNVTINYILAILEANRVTVRIKKLEIVIIIIQSISIDC